jgi:hypothetical protein
MPRHNPQGFDQAITSDSIAVPNLELLGGPDVIEEVSDVRFIAEIEGARGVRHPHAIEIETGAPAATSHRQAGYDDEQYWTDAQATLLQASDGVRPEPLVN